MALNLKDDDTVRLAGEVAALAGETKTRAIRVALEERLARLTKSATRESTEQADDRLERFLVDVMWPQVPVGVLGVPLDKVEHEEILGYGPAGV